MHMRRKPKWCVIATFGSVLSLSAAAQTTTNVVVNGSFESSPSLLTGWAFASATAATATGNCSYNAAVAPGMETVTSIAGFPATDGSNIALGSSQQTSPGEYSCTLYQDVAIPARATTATFSFDGGIIYNGSPTSNAAIFAGLYSTSSVPAYFSSSPLPSSVQVYEPTTSSTGFHHFSASINVSSLAGTTVRLAVMIGSDYNMGTPVIVLDNVQLQVTVPAPPAPTAIATPTLSEWGMIGLACLLMGYGAQRLRARGGAGV